MDIKVIEEEGRSEIEVTVVSAPGDPRVPRIVDKIRAASGRVVGYPNGASIERRMVSLADVTHIETIDGHALIHTLTGETLESPMRLFELAAALDGTEFVRASRQVLVNFDHVTSIRPELNGRLDLELTGSTKVLVTRSFARAIQQKIGIVL